MKVAVIGSRGLTVCHLEKYLPEGTAEIVSGGAKGVDTCARAYALKHGIRMTEFLPDYKNTDAAHRSSEICKSLHTVIWCLRSGMENPAAPGML